MGWIAKTDLQTFYEGTLGNKNSAKKSS